MKTTRSLPEPRPQKTFFQWLLLCFALPLSASLSWAQGNAFTYQGQLRTSGTPTNGAHDFEFKLFDAVSDGNQLGATNTATNVTVTNGVFTLTLDFGAQFNGQPRWLDISVRTAGGGAFTPLAPRQPLTSAPYAVRSASAGTADNATQLGGTAANQFVLTTDARLSDARTPTAGSANYIQNSAAQQAAANFNISGDGMAAGTLTGNLINSATNYSINNQRVLSNAGTNNLLVGVNAGAGNTTGNNNVFVGAAAGDANVGGNRNTLLGSNADVSTSNLTNATAIGANAVAATSNVIVLGEFNGNGNGGTVNTRVGIGTNAPAASLEINNDNFSPDDALLITQHSNGGGGGEITLRQTRGTRAAPLATQANDNLFFLNASGYTGTGFNSSGVVRVMGEATQNWTATNNGARLTFWTTSNNAANAAERLRIDQNGNVGIGTGEIVNPSVRLHVVDDGGKNGTIRAGSNEFWTAGETRRILFGDGFNAYVGEEDSDDHLVLRGRLGIRFKGNTNQMVGPSVDDTLVLGGAANRWKQVWAVDGTINTSDARLKTGVANLSYGLRHLMQLRPVSFQWKDRAESRTQLGLLAQEVEQVIPEAVVRGQDEATPLGMNYTTLLPVLIKAVQEQQAQIAQQAELLKAQAALLQQQQAQLAALQKPVKARRTSRAKR